MEWNTELDKSDGHTERSGTFKALGKEYTLEENPIIFSLGGILTTGVTVAVFVGLFAFAYVFLTYFGAILMKGLAVAFALIMFIAVLGVLKYWVTGNARPFAKIETDETSFSVSLIDW